MEKLKRGCTEKSFTLIGFWYNLFSCIYKDDSIEFTVNREVSKTY